ncbi:MAG: DNA-processing protein DprA [Deltaproteobacteria bacterium]|nr:DNA-processing protein DprA [Candidatus Zymogenaceae bacterium]
MDSKRYDLALSRVPRVGNVTFRKLVRHFGGAKEAFEAGYDRLLASGIVGEKLARSIVSFSDWDPIEKELDRVRSFGADIIGIEDDEYPFPLGEIYDPPGFLYVLGSLEPVDHRSVAVIGSRNPTHYGVLSTERIAGGLAAEGITIVSGMARGIDSLAHEAALKNNGRTIAVLGSGLDVIYPPENKELAESIAENGAVVSEFPLGTGPEAQNFPRRNRIISGMSLGVVIVEARIKSGALITANLALEQNREVFAVPGNINNPRSKGTHRLIRDGAKLVESARDVIEELPGVLGGRFFVGGGTDKTKSPLVLTDDERKVLENIGHEPVYVDIIIDESGLASERVLEILLELELKHVVRQIPGKSFIRIVA